MPTTPILLMPYPAPSAVPDVPIDMQALADRIETVLGSAWAAWTPTVSGLTLGNGVLVARYKQMGKTVLARLSLTMGSTTTFSGTFGFTLPVALHASGYGERTALGSATLYDFSSGASSAAVAQVNATGGVKILANTAVVATAIPWTWAVTDLLTFEATYEAA